MNASNSAFDVPSFAQRCMDASVEVWREAVTHPFVRALAEGTLSKDIFRFYQMQDARYLEAFSDAAAIASTRCVQPVDKLWFLESCMISLKTEGELHAGYGEQLGYTLEDVAAVELTPNNRAYQNHMISTAMRGTSLEAISALAPCPWLYIDIGVQLLQELGQIEDTHPYADWLRMYSDPGFVDFVNELLSRMERFAAQVDEAARLRAVDAFKASARYEWMFWEQAWTQQGWPV